MLAIAPRDRRAARLLLIDEPSKGLAPAIMQNMIAALRELKRTRDHDPAGRAEFRVRHAPSATRVAVMDDGRVVHRGRMAELAADEALQQRLLGLSLASASMSARTQSWRRPAAPCRRRLGTAARPIPKARFDWLPLALVPVLALAAAADRLDLDLGHADRRRPGDGHDDLHHRLGPDAGLRPDGRAELRPRRLHRARRLSSPPACWRRHGRLDHGARALAQPRGACFARCWPRWRWPAPSAGRSSACIVRPVYGQHLKQILITMGGLIVGEELIKVIWGRRRSRCQLPAGAARRRSLFGDAAVEKYRLLAVAIGAGRSLAHAADARTAPSSAC